eukprot:TRINITY_DN1988_c0_g1_i5.p1 TRINITY_DN1988_c0_g1~~TRINITY_DN1988_c0_g1_i5.p1  ORF type:complete len:300 (+),score=59.47 TRINITY_DN1988_c0_g1_i5:210-1109(+)
MLTQYDCKSLKGTPYWMAPEVIMQAGHGRSADIWSVGATVVEMLTGKPPYSEFPTQVSVLFHIASTQEPPTLPADLHDETRSFLMLCFQRNPKQRPTAKALLDHPFVSSARESNGHTPVMQGSHHKQGGSPKVVVQAPGAPQEWFRGAPPQHELPSPSIKAPVGLPKATRQMNTQHKLEPTGAGQISSYLNDILHENEKQLSGDFRESLKLLMTKSNGRTKRRSENSSAEHAEMASPSQSSSRRTTVHLPEEQPITSAYTMKVKKEQDEIQSKIDEETEMKMAQHKAWQQELEQAKHVE